MGKLLLLELVVWGKVLEGAYLDNNNEPAETPKKRGRGIQRGRGSLDMGSFGLFRQNLSNRSTSGWLIVAYIQIQSMGE
jgi:hypothetical protein